MIAALHRCHPLVPWPKIRDIGNVLRHGYEDVDPQIIRSMVTEEVAPLKAAVAAMIDEVDRSCGRGEAD